MITITSPGADRNRGLDGVRALAVGAVVAFHAGQTWAPGGYLGVDSFFVLSGFLITALLLRERSRTGRIGLREFWGRRLARLIPALATMVLVVVIVEGMRNPDALATLRGDAVAALGYVANWRFIIENHGYFGQTRLASLFEHTWSLSIEEQFYLVWPLLVVVLARARRPRLAVGVVAGLGAAASAAATVLLARGGASNARIYFGTDTRLQAILIGAALAAVLTSPEGARPRWARGRDTWLHLLAIAGLAGTALLWANLDGGSPTLFRGGITVAALATAAVIPSLVVAPNGIVGRVLGVGPLRALGLISYGVYLWHWPIQLLVTRSAVGWQGTPLIVLRAVLTVAAATLSYVCIERPLRQRPTIARVRLVTFSAVAAGTAVIVVVATTVSLPAPDPLVAAASVKPTTTVAAAPLTTVAAPTTTVTRAPTPAPAKALRLMKPPTTVVPLTVYRTEILGDSVADSVADGLAPVSSRYGLALRDDSLLGCGIAPTGDYRLRGVEHYPALPCLAWESTWTSRVQSAKANVAVIQLGRHEVLDTKVDGEWRTIFDAPLSAAITKGLDRAIQIASSTGARVVLLTAPYYDTGRAPNGSPYPENDPKRVNRFNQLLREAAGRHPGTIVVDLGGYTNPGGRYAATVRGVRMRKDGVHYAPGACSWFAPWLNPQIRAAAQR